LDIEEAIGKFHLIEGNACNMSVFVMQWPWVGSAFILEHVFLISMPACWVIHRS